MTPGVLAALAEVERLVAVLGGLGILALAVGWSVVGWVDKLPYRRDRERQRRLLAHLYDLEVACGTEFPQVGATVAYVRRLVLEDYEQDVVAFRATLRVRYGGERRGEGGQAHG